MTLDMKCAHAGFPKCLYLWVLSVLNSILRPLESSFDAHRRSIHMEEGGLLALSRGTVHCLPICTC